MMIMIDQEESMFCSLSLLLTQLYSILLCDYKIDSESFKEIDCLAHVS